MQPPGPQPLRKDDLFVEAAQQLALDRLRNQRRVNLFGECASATGLPERDVLEQITVTFHPVVVRRENPFARCGRSQDSTGHSKCTAGIVTISIEGSESGAVHDQRGCAAGLALQACSTATALRRAQPTGEVWSSKLVGGEFMSKLSTVMFLIGLMLLVLAAPAAANYSNGPDSAGVVERFDSPGLAVVPDFEDGLLVFVNVNSIEDACNGIPAGAGDEQLVFTPNRVNAVLQDDDVPVIVAPLGPEEEVCAGDWPVIAEGIGDVHAANGGIRVIGTVQDASGDLWNVKAGFGPSGPDVNLVLRGRS